MKNQKSKIKNQKQAKRLKTSFFSFDLRFDLCILIFALIIIIPLYFLFYTPADASAFSLGIYPPIIKIEADPPANIETPIIIQNPGEEALDLDIIFKPFTAADSENGEVKYTTTPPPPIFENIQIFEGDKPLPFCHPSGHSPEEGNPINKETWIPGQARNDNDAGTPCLTLAPKQQKKLNLNIEIKKDTPISDYYFSIVFISSNQSESIKNTQIPGGIATNILLSIGKGKAEGVIEEFSAPLILEKGPVPFTTRIKNTGKHAIAPTGQILIKNMFGQTVGKVDLLPVNVLAQTTRIIPDSGQARMTSSWGAAATPGSVSDFRNPHATWPESFLLGPYTANLTIALSGDGPLYKKTVNFFGFPFQLLIGIIIAILIVAMIIHKVKSRV